MDKPLSTSACIELPQLLPEGWTQQTSQRTGTPYYFHAETKQTMWDIPLYTGLPKIQPQDQEGCSENNCISRRNQDILKNLLTWMRQQLYKHVVSGTHVVVDLACGPCAPCGPCEPQNSPPILHAWSVPELQDKIGKFEFDKWPAHTIFEQFSVFSGTSVPISAPTGKADVVLCTHFLPLFFATASYARRCMRVIKSLLRPKGSAVLLFPNASYIQENTANGCADFSFDNTLIQPQGTWPSNWSVAVYGAMYNVCTSSGSEPCWLVTHTTLCHAAATSQLHVSLCTSAYEFFFQQGVNPFPHISAWNEFQTRWGGISASQSEEFHKYTVAILTE